MPSPRHPATRRRCGRARPATGWRSRVRRAPVASLIRTGGLQLNPPSAERLSMRSLPSLPGTFCSHCTHSAPSAVAARCGVSAPLAISASPTTIVRGALCQWPSLHCANCNALRRPALASIQAQQHPSVGRGDEIGFGRSRRGRQHPVVTPRSRRRCAARRRRAHQRDGRQATPAGATTLAGLRRQARARVRRRARDARARGAPAAARSPPASCPGMRCAWPIVSGRTRSSFCRTSVDSPRTAA